MRLVRALVGFRGRIGRLPFLLGLALLVVLSPFSLRAIVSPNPVNEMLAEIRATGLVGLGWSLALLWVLASLMTRRLHDRGRSGLYAALFYLPAAIEIVRFFPGVVPKLENVAFWGGVLRAWLGVSGVWFLIQLGFLGGEHGANAYGPDPNQRAQRK